MVLGLTFDTYLRNNFVHTIYNSYSLISGYFSVNKNTSQLWYQIITYMKYSCCGDCQSPVVLDMLWVTLFTLVHNMQLSFIEMVQFSR